MHVIAQRVCTLSNYKLVFGTSRVIESVIGFKQGAAWHASVELAIWIAGRRRENTVVWTAYRQRETRRQGR